MKTTWIVTQQFDKKTLKDYFAQTGVSTTQVKRYKYNGSITVNGKSALVTQMLNVGDVVQLSTNKLLKTPSFAQQEAEVLWQDDYLYVTNKPYGTAIHPDLAHKNDTLGNMLATHFGSEFELRIVTRLDKTTSGLVLGARNEVVCQQLNTLLQNNKITKNYVALVNGTVEQPNGTIDLPLTRVDAQNKTIVDERGKKATTIYHVIRNYDDGTTLLSLQPITGRTHQLRAHLSAIGHPIVGDSLYGGTSYHRLCLHCCNLQFVHPVTGQLVNVTCKSDF